MTKKKKSPKTGVLKLLAQAAADLADELNESVSQPALRSLLMQLGYPVSSAWKKKKDLAQRIAEHWMEPNRARQAIHRLRREEALAFAYAIRSSPYLNQPQWVRNLLHAYGGKERDWITTIERLLLAGMVFKAEHSPYGYDRQTWYMVPSVLCEVLAPVLPQCPAVRTLPPITPDLPITVAPKVGVPQCAAFLCAMRQAGLKVNRNDSLNQRDVKRLSALLPADWPLSVEDAVQMFTAAGCIRVDSESQRAHLVPERIAELLRSEAQVRSLRLTLMMGLRRSLATLLIAVVHSAPLKEWAPLDAIEVARAWANYILDQFEDSDLVIPRRHFRAAQEPLAQLLEEAAKQSFFEVLRDQDGRILALRASDELLAIANPPPDARPSSAKPAGGATAGGRLHVQPNLDVIAPPDTPGDVLAQLISFVDLKQADVVVTYRLTESACRRAAQDGMAADTIIELLKKNSAYGLSENVAQTVHGWMRNAGAIRFVQGLILHCVQAAAAAELKNNPSLRHCILQELTPQLFIVDGKAYKKIREALEQRGFILPLKINKYPLEGYDSVRDRWDSSYERARAESNVREEALDFSELQTMIGGLLADAAALWQEKSGRPVSTKSGTAAAGQEGRLSIYNPETGETQTIVISERAGASNGAAKKPLTPSRSPSHNSTSRQDTAIPAKPSLTELTPLPEEALIDSLNKAIHYGLNAFIAYPREGGRGPSVLHIAPHWMEDPSGRRPVLWAYCAEMDREYGFLVSKITGILLMESDG